MITDFFVTKLGMTQAWTKEGKRLAVTRCSAPANMVVGKQNQELPFTVLEIGYGTKKLSNVHKPLRNRLQQGGFSVGVKKVSGTRVANDSESVPSVGSTITVSEVLTIGDVVQVQGTSKGKGFAGAVKRYGFAGGPKTHGQSDRHRAVGAIGNRTTPGRVWLGKRMPGHMGSETVTVTGLTVVYIDTTTSEIWLSGPVPGAIFSELKITKVGVNKPIELDTAASQVVMTEESVPTTTEEAQVA